jgi:hypothetical protein
MIQYDKPSGRGCLAAVVWLQNRCDQYICSSAMRQIISPERSPLGAKGVTQLNRFWQSNLFLYSPTLADRTVLDCSKALNISTSQRNADRVPIISGPIISAIPDVETFLFCIAGSHHHSVTCKIISGTYLVKFHWKNKCSKESAWGLKCAGPGRLRNPSTIVSSHLASVLVL